jgi:hypothetical protein
VDPERGGEVGRGPAGGERSQAGLSLLLFLGLWLAYLMTSSGGFDTSDAVLRYRTARSWLAGEGGVLPRELGWGGGAVLPDGRVYSFYGPLQSLLMVPFLLVADALPLPLADRSLLDTTIVSLGLFPLISAGTMTLGFHALRLLGWSARTSLLATLAIALGSLFWHYARMGQEENLVALAFSLWLWGAARMIAGKRWPATAVAAGAAAALATRWATAPSLLILFGASLLLARRHARALRWPDLALGTAVFALSVTGLLLYNWHRFGDALETGYGLQYAHLGVSMFELRHYGARLLALTASPYRGLLVYSPVVLIALAGLRLRRNPPSIRIICWAGVAVMASTLLLHAAFRFWTGGHAWGPRFLASPHVLLLPAVAVAFARWPRASLLLLALGAAQLLSVALPTSTEEYVRFDLEQKRPGHCTDWRLECTAVGQRPRRALDALLDTISGEPGIVLRGRPTVAPELVLATSDYRTLHWWPMRIAFRMGAISHPAALAITSFGLAAATAALLTALRRSRSRSELVPRYE